MALAGSVGGNGRVWFVLVIALLSLVVIALAWRQHQARARAEQERKDRRARADQVLARVLLGEDGTERRPLAVPPGLAAEPEAAVAPPPPLPAAPAPAPGQPADIDILLADESTTVAEQARRELGRPTTLLSDIEGAAAAGAAPGRLSLLDGRIDVSLDALVVAWFSARGYVAARAPESALPIRLLLTHRDDNERSYAFFFDRGRLHAQRAAELLGKAHALGMNRLLVAAEHGADPAVNTARLRDVLVMDWVALDRELRKIDFQVAAKIVALARSRRDALGLG
jgi:cbb3-type cytochrome oxidase subunit 3